MAISIMKSITLPADQSEWEEMEIVECIGTPEEHSDTFYRYDDVGVEEHADGQYQAYVIVETADGEEPMMLADGFQSFEEAVSYLQGHIGKKRLEDGGEKSDEEAPESEEDTTPVPADAPGAEGTTKTEDKEEKKMDEKIEKAENGVPPTETAPEIPDGPANMNEQNKNNIKQETPAPVEPVIKSGMKDAVPQADPEKDLHRGRVRCDGEDETVTHAKPNEGETQGTSVKEEDAVTQADKMAPPMKKPKSGETVAKSYGGPASFQDMVAARRDARGYGLPHGVESRSRMTIQKSANRAQYRANRYPTTYIGSGKDATGYLAGYRTGTTTRNADGASVRDYESRIKVTKGDGSFASMLAERQFQKAVDAGIPPQDAMDMAGLGADPAMGGAPVDPAAGGMPPMDPAMGGAPVDPAVGGAPVDPAVMDAVAGADAPMEGVPPEAGDGDGEMQWDVETAVAVLESIPPEILMQAIDIIMGGEGSETPVEDKEEPEGETAEGSESEDTEKESDVPSQPREDTA